MQQTRQDARHPFELFLLGACAFSGTTQALTGARPGSVASQLSPILQVLWAALLGLGGIVALSGILIVKSPWAALEMESIGLLATAGGCVIYGIAVIDMAGWSGVAAWAISIGFGFACLLRRRRVEMVLRPKSPKKRRWFQWWR